MFNLYNVLKKAENIHTDVTAMFGVTKIYTNNSLNALFRESIVNPSTRALHVSSLHTFYLREGIFNNAQPTRRGSDGYTKRPERLPVALFLLKTQNGLKLTRVLFIHCALLFTEQHLLMYFL